MPSLLDTLRPWQSFFSLFGGAAATLVGLLFVAASVGSGFYQRRQGIGLHAFLTPTLAQFSSVLFASLVAVAPIERWWMAGGLIGAAGLLGLWYSWSVRQSMVQHDLLKKMDLDDRVFYAAMPPLGYGILAVAGAMIFLHRELGCAVLAVALVGQMSLGIRNAWDMTVWTVIRGGD